ncbi:hypothetical protein [Mycobacterium seoulense]
MASTTTLLDVDRLDSWIGDQLPGCGTPMTAERIGGGDRNGKRVIPGGAR